MVYFKERNSDLKAQRFYPYGTLLKYYKNIKNLKTRYLIVYLNISKSEYELIYYKPKK